MYKKIEELKRSPIFALSKCNNESAHSNFWAWLIEYEDDQKNHPFLKLFVPDPDIVFDNVKREEKNRDLTIYYHKKDEPKESRCHIVENKLKSIPTVKQLERYEIEIEEVKLGDVFLKQAGCLLKKKIDFSRYCGQGISTNR